MRNKLYYGVGLLLGLAILVVTQMPGDKARMIVCDVGQGDGILITKGEIQVLVDGGPSSEKILSCLEKYVPFWDRTIDLIVLTNTDDDHMTGISAVLERYQVTLFVTSDGVHDSDQLSHLINILKDRKVGAKPVERGDLIKIGGSMQKDELSFQVLWPPDTINEYVSVFGGQMQQAKRKQILSESAKRGDLNDRSVVLLLLEDNRRILLTGDSGDKTEKSLLKLGDLPTIDVLKVGHHGSRYASSLDFLRMIRPRIAVISVGIKNLYGHPSPETLERLIQVGAEVRRTDKEGNIVIPL